MMMSVVLAAGKTLTDLTFGGAFLWYFVKAMISGILAYCAILLGIKLRKSKNAKQASVTAETE